MTEGDLKDNCRYTPLPAHASFELLSSESTCYPPSRRRAGPVALEAVEHRLARDPPAPTASASQNITCSMARAELLHEILDITGVYIRRFFKYSGKTNRVPKCKTQPRIVSCPWSTTRRGTISREDGYHAPRKHTTCGRPGRP